MTDGWREDGKLVKCVFYFSYLLRGFSLSFVFEIIKNIWGFGQPQGEKKTTTEKLYLWLKNILEAL